MPGELVNLMQTKKRSAYESISNILVGIVYAYLINYVLLHLQWDSIAQQAFWITFWFTLASFVRQYFMRRIFNWIDHRWP